LITESFIISEPFVHLIEKLGLGNGLIDIFVVSIKNESLIQYAGVVFVYEIELTIAFMELLVAVFGLVQLTTVVVITLIKSPLFNDVEEKTLLLVPTGNEFIYH
jgi:hypothetical protein